ncbi:MAG: BamA/TamA family outer membrane protein [Bacteroidota bacterium]|nr:BamA/TamA family outer membrane protein [Bacteroidota bacterium]
MAYKRTALICLVLMYSVAPCFAQQGGGVGQVPEDTLIRSRGEEKSGFKPVANHNTFYRIHVGIAYNKVFGDSSQQPYSSKHTFGINYSITEKSFHPYYKGLFPKLLAGWDLALTAGYDGVRRMNYYGIGNETVRDPSNEKFNWLRTENLYGSIELNRTLFQHHTVGIEVLYDGIRVRPDADRLTSRTLGKLEPEQYDRQDFLGSRLTYAFAKVDRPIIPLKGWELSTSAAYTENLRRSGHSFARFTGDLDVYLPLVRNFSLALSTGLATVTGNPDFFQLNTVGGTNSIRGYERFRFYGKTSFYNQNEFRWLPTINTRLYSGEIGIFTFYDQGRVWHPDDESTNMHSGYGAGLIVSPLNKVTLKLAYGISKEDKRFHLNLKRIL